MNCTDSHVAVHFTKKLGFLLVKNDEVTGISNRFGALRPLLIRSLQRTQSCQSYNGIFCRALQMQRITADG